uniref:Uncharacterized protein n=1 Tax=Caenorhabditis japonica TaxID=281687 RepID=A0A8R1E5R9_CAEJA
MFTIDNGLPTDRKLFDSLSITARRLIIKELQEASFQILFIPEFLPMQEVAERSEADRACGTQFGIFQENPRSIMESTNYHALRVSKFFRKAPTQFTGILLHQCSSSISLGGPLCEESFNSGSPLLNFLNQRTVVA